VSLPRTDPGTSAELLNGLTVWVETESPTDDASAVNRLVDLAEAGLRAAGLGLDLPKQHRGGGSDGNVTAALGVPTLDGLGCTGAGAHADHAHILWPDLAPRAALLLGLLETLH